MAMEMPVSDLPLGVFCNKQHHQMAIQWLCLEICCKETLVCTLVHVCALQQISRHSHWIAI